MIQETALLSEREVLARLAGQKDLYSPLQITSIEPLSTAKDPGFDVKISLNWRRRKVTFIAEVKTRTSPKLITESLLQLKNYSVAEKRNVLLIVPFLSKSIVEILDREELSGLDLNGNFMIQTPDMVAIRLDKDNQFKESQSIKKVFSANSSLVGRLFLSGRGRFDSVSSIYAAIKERGGSLSLSAVSKVLKSLESELIIEKSESGISLIQPEKLLKALEDGYRPPKITAEMKLKFPGSGLEVIRKLSDALSSTPARWMLNGESSAQRYAVTTSSEAFTVYAADLDPPWMQEYLRDYESERFFNVTLKKLADTFPLFDMRTTDGIPWSSPVQCYLELSKLDKREREIGETVRKAILGKTE